MSAPSASQESLARLAAPCGEAGSGLGGVAIGPASADEAGLDRARWLTLAGSLLVLALLAAAAWQQSGATPSGVAVWRYVAVADTDSVATDAPADTVDLPPLDPADVESLRVAALGDTATFDTTRAATYFPMRSRDDWLASIIERRNRPFDFAPGGYWRREATLDSAALRYTVREVVGEEDVRVPVETDLAGFQAALRGAAITDNFRSLAAEQLRRRSRGRGGLGLTIGVPGGRGGAFETIFGKNEVDLRVTGNANINLGFSYQENEQQQAATGQGGRLNPDFAQELALGITGTIGDKLQINVNYDTQNTFEFENQVKLLYEGYDDDIIQRIEAGNVFLQTPSDLIRGGQRLFGIRTDLRFGGLGVTLVASQQDAEGDALEIEGGSQTTEFDIAPYEYEDNAHFFLSYYFRNRWEDALSRPPSIVADPNFDQIVGIDVWLQDRTVNQTNQLTEGLAQAVALVDLGEPGPGSGITGLPNGVLEGADAYLGVLGASAPLPSETLDQYDPADLELLRDSSNAVDYRARFNLDIEDYADTRFRKLAEGRDYVFNPELGYLSLNRSLSPDERIAVAFQYRRRDGTIVQVGDFNRETGTDQNGQRIILKLLRSDNPVPTDASWGLTMRNIYRIGGRSLNPTDFELNIVYEPSGQPTQPTLPGVTIGQQRTLLTTLGLDRLDNDGRTPTPNDEFDFVNGLTINAGEGRVIFPFLKPFGERLRAVFEGRAQLNGQELDVQFTGAGGIADAAAATNAYAFDTLYTSKQENARRFPGLDRYAIVGSFRSSVQEAYSLGFAVVEGSVRVTSGGVELAEGTDYTVDYATGEVIIVNRAYLTPGQNIKIDYERNQFAAIGRKTLLGFRADYALGDNLELGGTWMRLSERPLIDKYRIGEEPIDNTIFGFDGRFAAEPRWLTRFVDALPLVQTKAPSAFEVRGEFARFEPGHPETFAFEQGRQALQANNRDFKPDELDGISFIDDFEGTENSFSLLQPGAWQLAAAPEAAGPMGSVVALGARDVTDPALASNWRGLFTWYSLQPFLYTPGGLVRRIGETRATRRVPIREIFANREVRQQESEFIAPLDLYLDPTRRGPYNYNGELGTAFAEAPADVWGGMVQRLPEGYNDFDGRNNIEFVEFIVAPYGGRDGSQAVSDGAVLYVDLGQISEDVLPDGRFNTEDGLVETDIEDGLFGPYGRIPTGNFSGSVDFDDATRRTEDLGLDGLRSAADIDGGTPYAVAERGFFADFLATLGNADPLDRALAEVDPSGDDYHYFEDDAFFENPAFFEGGEATVQERFSRFFPGLELNAFESQQQLGGGQGNSTFPDDEDLDRDNSPDRAESFYRYAIPLSPGIVDVPCEFEGQDNCNPFFVNRVGAEGAQEWVLMRIPVRSQVGREAFGGIEDFSRVEAIRLWTDGHQVPATLRFATLDLVGSQWLKSDLVGFGEDADEDDPDDGPSLPSNPLETQLFVATINNEENPDQYETPTGALVSNTRDISGELIPQREQAIVLRAEDLGPGQARGIYRSYSGQLDLTKYSNLRMFVHAEDFDRERGDSLRVFVRLGTNETEDYYEIEQPVYPYEADRAGSSPNPDSLWQTNVFIGGEEVDLNSINVVLSALNQLKVERNNNPDALPLQRYQGVVSPPGAPPGARLFIRGNPSIESVTTIVLGFRNVSPNVLDPEVWFNELRVAGYDEEPGWSAYATASLDLADLATVRARVDRQTAAFGELASGLGDRTFTDQQAYTLNTTVNAEKLVPERFGLRLPVTVSVQQRTTTPRFSPRRGGDIRLDDLIEQARNDPNLSQAQQDSLVALYREESETASYTRTISVPFSKSGSRSPWLRYTLDGLALTYSNTRSERRSPSERFSNSASWNASLRYRLQPRGVQTVRPFWLLDGAPLLGILADLQLNLLPSSLSFQADATRTVSENQQRPPVNVAQEIAAVPERYRNAIRENHVFTHRRNFELNYSPFSFLALGYRSDLNQTLSAIGADRTNDTFVIDSTGAPVDGGEFVGLTPAEVAPLIDPAFTEDSLAANGFRTFTTERLDIVPVFGVVGDVVGGQRAIQTDRYGQTFSATLTPRFQGLRWFRPQPIAYSSAFQWTFQPLANLVPGEQEDRPLASVSNALSLRTGLTLGPRDFLRGFGFYTRIEDAEERYQAERRRQRTARESAQRRREQMLEEAEERGEELSEEELAELEVPEGAGPPAPASIARQIFLALTGISDLSVTYNGGRSTQSGALDGSSYNLFDALTGEGPSLAYRLGLRDRPRRTAFDPDIFNSLQVNDVVARTNDVQARTSLQLTQSLRVDLNWNLGWDRSTTFSFTTLDTDEDGVGDVVDQASPIESGGNSATIWALGGSYERFVALHRERFEADLAAGLVTDEGEPLTTALSNNGLTEDFRNAFTSSFGSFGPNNFFALPLPNWSVTYSGLSNWPLLRLLTQQVTLRHGYSATYDLDYRSDARIFDQPGFTESETIDGTIFQVPVDARQSESVRLNERFQPLLGFNTTFKGGIQADINFTKSRALSLSVAGASVAESTTDEVSVRLSFSKTGLRIPLPFLNRRRINNNVRFSLTLSNANNVDQRINFDDDFVLSLRGEPLSDPDPIASTRLTLEPRVSYTVSSQVTVDVFARYTSLESEGSQIPSTSTLNGGFNFRVSFSN